LIDTAITAITGAATTNVTPTISRSSARFTNIWTLAESDGSR